MDPGTLVVLFLLVPTAFAIYAANNARGRAVSDRESVTRVAAIELGLEARDNKSYARYVEGGHELVLTGKPEGRRQLGERVTVEVRLRQPIATELSVVTKDALRADLPVPSISVSDDFDLYFRLQSRRTERARRIVQSGLRRLLLDADRVGFVIELDHTAVTVTSRWVTQIEEVERAIGVAVTISKALIDAERAQPELVPWREVARVWSEVAERIGAQFDRESHVLSGTIAAGSVQGHPSSEREERWFANLTLVMQRPLPMRLALSDEAARTLWQRWTSPDLVLGDGQFDAVFYVSGDNPDAIRRLLGKDVQSALLDLERHTAGISISEQRIEAQIEGPRVTQLEALAEALDALIAAAEALDRAARPAGRGAYR